MSQINGYALKRWNKGDGLAAVDLNSNFASIYEMAEAAILEARTPDRAVVDLEMRHAAVAARVERLESMVAMHARQRNEKEWAPLAHLGAVLVRVTDLQRTVEDAVARLESAHASVIAIHDKHHVRLSRLEQQPEAASIEAHNVLAELHTDTMHKARIALNQAISLRTDVMQLRDMVVGHARKRNEMEWTPLAYFGHLLQRVMEIEKRLEPEAHDG